MGHHFWARGYFVSTVGRDEQVIREYIRYQEQEDLRIGQRQLVWGLTPSGVSRSRQSPSLTALSGSQTKAPGFAGGHLLDCIAIIIYYYAYYEDKGKTMASITIRNLDDKVKTRLRILAAGHGRSMEEEARLILAGAVEQDLSLEKGLGTTLHELFKPLGGVELKLPPREPMRDPPSFE